jgi:hypothetical protein
MEKGDVTNYVNPAQYTNKMNEINGGVDILLDEFKKIYVITKMHPNNEEYKQKYENIVSSFTQIQSKLFTITNDVQVNINELNKKLHELDVLIKIERKKNKELKKKLGIVEIENNSSSEMIDNYKTIYDTKYLQNWALLLSIIVCIITIGVTYKKQDV